METAGWSWREGVAAGDVLADSLAGRLPAAARHLKVVADHPAIKLALPQRLALPLGEAGMTRLQLRLNRAVQGVLEVRDGSEVLWTQSLAGLPERRILLPLRGFIGKVRGDTLTLSIAGDRVT